MLDTSLPTVVRTLAGALEQLFGPIKYGILPDHLAREDLPAGGGADNARANSC